MKWRVKPYTTKRNEIKSRYLFRWEDLITGNRCWLFRFVFQKCCLIFLKIFNMRNMCNSKLISGRSNNYPQINFKLPDKHIFKKSYYGVIMTVFIYASREIT